MSLLDEGTLYVAKFNDDGTGEWLPLVGGHGAYWAGWQGEVSTIATPDNIAFDRLGNMWITTDGQSGTIQANDGLYAVPCTGAERGAVRQFLSALVGAEMTGPEFTSDNLTLFVSVQHPGSGGTFNRPISTWPDGEGNTPRPSVIALTENRGRVIGS